MTFLYQTPTGYIMSQNTHRELRRTHPRLELIRTFRNPQDCISFCEHQGILLDILPTRTRGITEAGRQRMRDAKTGQNNPNAGGLSQEHREKISRTKKLRMLEHLHPMLGRQHRASSKLKTSWTMRQLPPRRWCVDPDGQEHYITIQHLPPGWSWGRARHVNRRL